MSIDFFRINLPYGMQRNEKGQWIIFNRRYKPLGYNQNVWSENYFADLPIHTAYKGLTEKVLLSIAAKDGKAIKRDEKGQICSVWLYNDATNPMNDSSQWKTYWSKLEILAKLKIK
ncbi:hypothetical protein Barb6_01076 [Bacteroidales bacterium Barb6]|nr:hypothetical protein Barb6_01076 [Bacteroidales bacterium Barb6]